MTITSIEPYGKTKFKIYIDEQFAFVLYKGELSRYCLREGETVSEEMVAVIEREVILKRAKLRAMHLLNDMSYSEAKLRAKLRQNCYCEKAIDGALEYVKSFGYIDDVNYARNYVQSRQGARSKKQIMSELVKRGISKEVILRSLEEYYDNGESQGEREAIRTLIRKRRYQPDTATVEEKRKMYGYLARKGFRYEDIQQVLQISEWNT